MFAKIAARSPWWLVGCMLIGMSVNHRSEAAGFLRTQGQKIIGENGEPIMLRGVGLGNWLLPEGYMWKFGEHGDRPRKIEAIVSELIGPDNSRRFWTEFRDNYITEKDIERIAKLGFNSVRPALNARLFLTEDESPVFVEESFVLLDRLIAWCKKHGVYVILDMHSSTRWANGCEHRRQCE